MLFLAGDGLVTVLGKDASVDCTLIVTQGIKPAPLGMIKSFIQMTVSSLTIFKKLCHISKFYPNNS